MIIECTAAKSSLPPCESRSAGLIYEQRNPAFSEEKTRTSIIRTCSYLAFQANARGLRASGRAIPAAAITGGTVESVRTCSGAALILHPGEDIFACIKDMLGDGRPCGIPVTPLQSFEDALMLTRLDFKPA
jgi:hypothetical protein